MSQDYPFITYAYLGYMVRIWTMFWFA